MVLGAGVARAEPTRAHHHQGEAKLTGPVTREALVAAALARSPDLVAIRSRARAMRLEGAAEARLPPPMAEVQLFQVPVMEPWAVNRAGMIMIGVEQDFPAAGVRRARAHAARVGAGVDAAMSDEQARMLASAVEHAFTDYVEATELVRIHEDHCSAADRVLLLAQARYAAGGSLADIAQAERERAMIEPELEMARAQIALARARLNGLLVRPPDAELGPPSPPPTGNVRAEARALVAQAQAQRPELRVAQAKRDAAAAEADAEARMARSPMVSAGLYYFAPTEPMPEHGFGASFSTTLPWLWGAPQARSRAAQARHKAALDEQDAVRARIAQETMTAAAEVAVMAQRLESIESRVLPASRRAEEATLAGYEASRADILGYLMARTAVASTEVEAVQARAALEHALVELRWATGSSGGSATKETDDVR